MANLDIEIGAGLILRKILKWIDDSKDLEQDSDEVLKREFWTRDKKEMGKTWVMFGGRAAGGTEIRDRD